MALLVEDGTGVTGAESYMTLAAFKAYRSRSGLSIGAQSDADLEAALIRGSAAVDGLFGGRFPGTRYSGEQGLEWPRLAAWDRDGLPLVGLPVEISRAAAEAALVELSSPGALTKKVEPGLRSLAVGSISKGYGPQGAAVAYPAIKQALGRVLGACGVQLSRG